MLSSTSCIFPKCNQQNTAQNGHNISVKSCLLLENYALSFFHFNNHYSNIFLKVFLLHYFVRKFLSLKFLNPGNKSQIKKFVFF